MFDRQLPRCHYRCPPPTTSARPSLLSPLLPALRPLARVCLSFPVPIDESDQPATFRQQNLGVITEQHLPQTVDGSVPKQQRRKRGASSATYHRIDAGEQRHQGGVRILTRGGFNMWVPSGTVRFSAIFGACASSKRMGSPNDRTVFKVISA